MPSVTGSTKNNKTRVITLPKPFVKQLEEHLARFPVGPSEYVFQGERGGTLNRLNFLQRVWKPALKKAEIRPPLPRVHDLRHTAVSFAIQVGAHPKEIQARAGHSSITLTMDRYGHLFPGQDEALADRLTELWWHDGGMESVPDLGSKREAKGR